MVDYIIALCLFALGALAVAVTLRVLQGMWRVVIIFVVIVLAVVVMVVV